MPKAAAIFPLRDLWLPLLPALPLVLAATLLSGLLPSPDPGAPAAQSLASLMPHASKFSATPEAERNYNHLGDILTYCALASVHTLLCLGVIATLSKFATGLSTYWGAMFSMTLVATFIAPALRLIAEAYGAETAAREGAHLRQWLHDHVFQSIKHQFGTVLSLMAPLLVGPLSSLLSSLSGF